MGARLKKITQSNEIAGNEQIAKMHFAKGFIIRHQSKKGDEGAAGEIVEPKKEGIFLIGENKGTDRQPAGKHEFYNSSPHHIFTSNPVFGPFLCPPDGQFYWAYPRKYPTK